MTALRLLLVDDDADDRDFFAEAVREIDPSIDCMTAQDGATGIAYLQQATTATLPNYIFLDLRMPGMSGRNFLQLVKENARLQHIPVIVYSTSSDVKDAEDLVGLGASHFTTKPVNPDEIYYVLSVILGEKW